MPWVAHEKLIDWLCKIYEMNCQSKVFLGSSIEDEKEQVILKICEKNKLELLKARPSFSKYKLAFDPIYKP